MIVLSQGWSLLEIASKDGRYLIRQETDGVCLMRVEAGVRTSVGKFRSFQEAMDATESDRQKYPKPSPPRSFHRPPLAYQR